MNTEQDCNLIGKELLKLIQYHSILNTTYSKLHHAGKAEPGREQNSMTSIFTNAADWLKCFVLVTSLSKPQPTMRGARHGPFPITLLLLSSNFLFTSMYTSLH